VENKRISEKWKPLWVFLHFDERQSAYQQRVQMEAFFHGCQGAHDKIKIRTT
jgi:hypothetical protein